jgi:PAS domain S-box-containing protein
MEISAFGRSIAVLVFLCSACAALWVSAFAFYGLRKERGRPFSLLCAVTALWNLLFAVRLVFPAPIFPDLFALHRVTENLTHLSYSLIPPLLYVFSRGDGFRGLRSWRGPVLLGFPLAINAIAWLLLAEQPFVRPSATLRLLFDLQVGLAALLVVLAVAKVLIASRKRAERERASVARVLIGTFVFVAAFGLFRIGTFGPASFDPSPIAVTVALVIVGAGYRRLDPFTAAATKEERLKRFEFMADASREYMSIINRDHRYEAVNRAFCQSMGKSRDDIVGQKVDSIWGTENFTENILAPLRSCLDGSSLSFRSRFSFGKRPDVHLEVSYYPYVPAGAAEPTHAVVITKDITDYAVKEQELEEARREADRSNHAKGDFLASMSHEIRTPLNAIMGLVELALRGDLPAALRDDLETVKAASVNLLAIVNDILDLSKIEAGRMRLESVPFSPSESISRVVKSFRPAVERKGISLDFAVDPAVPAQVMGDPLRFSQVLYNLVGNAVKFTERGGVSVLVSLRPTGFPDPYVDLTVEVRDTGIGIATERLESIFESFTQADAGTSRRYGGSGLGLTISRRIARMLGGDVRVRSEIGSGSSFFFDASFPPVVEGALPAEVPAEPIRSDVSGAGPAETSGTPRGTILLVEDNPINARVAVRFLSSIGWAVRHASTAQESIALLRAGRFDLVLMDLELPDMDGLEATRLIRSGEAGERARSARIVAMTAHSIVEARSRCLAAGMDDFITKPLDFADLESILSSQDASRSRAVAEAERGAAPGPESVVAELPVIDRKDTLRRLGGDAELLDELYAIMRAEAPARTAEALALAEAGDYAALASVAHKVKGSAASLGALRLSAAASALQGAARSGGDVDVRSALTAFLEAYAQTFKSLETGPGDS